MKSGTSDEASSFPTSAERWSFAEHWRELVAAATLSRSSERLSTSLWE